MTDEEFQKQKKEIFEKLGKPEYDQHEPVNEAARQYLKLRSARASSARREQKNQRQKQLLDTLTEAQVEKAKTLPPDAIDVDEDDLLTYTEDERMLLRGYFEDITQSSKTLANRFGWNYQAVTKFINRRDVQALQNKYFVKVFGANVRSSLIKLAKTNPQVAMAGAEYLSILGKEDKQASADANEPILDRRLELVAKAVGDWLAGDLKYPLTLDASVLKDKA